MKISYTDSIVESLVIHYVGNKNNDEDLKLSKSETPLTDELSEALKTMIFSSYKAGELFQFFHESDLELNEVYAYARKVFDNHDELYEQSRNLAMHLYRQTMHPKIKAGEFYTVLIRDCEINGSITDVIAILKSENKENFIKISENNDSLLINLDAGISLKKAEKACLIFNIENEDGFVVSIVDNVSKGNEAMYWIDDFLYVQSRKDEYFHTKNAMTLCKTFVAEQMPTKYEVSKAEQADLLNKSMNFFKENDVFDVNIFAEEVMKHPEIIEDFKSFKDDFMKENAVEIHENFDISESAVKKQSKFFKSVIKLDRNFHIYVHGKKELIEKGFDSSNGMNFYKLYFENEE